MLSGGLDSTGVLYLTLTDPKYARFEILVHHIHLKNVENRAPAEAEAVKKVVNYCQAIRPFAYTESTFEYPAFGNSFLFDTDVCNFMAGSICMQLPQISQVFIGRTKDDDADPSFAERTKRSSSIFSCFAQIGKKSFPVGHFTKLQIRDLLPPELVKMTWSCRTPIYIGGIPEKCGHCKFCKKFDGLI
jgi:7-cyano-7-deazaguanine synthase in queuosine biosynthesis